MANDELGQDAGEPDVDVTEAQAADAGDARPKDPMASISGHITVLSPGERAMLRRMYLTRKVSAEGVVVKLLAFANVPVPNDPATFAPWQLIAHSAALLAGTAGQVAHARGKRLGEALHAAGYSENRLLRLCAARSDALQDQIVRAVRVLAQAGKGPVNLWTLFHLVGRDSDAAEEARLRIARDYYAARAAAN